MVSEVTWRLLAGESGGRGLFISWWMGSKKRGRKGLGSQCPHQGHTPNDLTSFYLLKAPLPPNSSMDWEPDLHHKSLQKTFHIQMIAHTHANKSLIGIKAVISLLEDQKFTRQQAQHLFLLH
jgi:hypothetical protein